MMAYVALQSYLHMRSSSETSLALITVHHRLHYPLSQPFILLSFCQALTAIFSPSINSHLFIYLSYEVLNSCCGFVII